VIESEPLGKTEECEQLTDLWNDNLAALPLSHVYGLIIVTMSTMLVGGTIVLLPKFDPSLVLDGIETFKISLMVGAPAMYELLLKEIEERKADFSSLRLCFAGGAPISIDLFHRVERMAKVPLITAYGLTESARLATANPLHGERKLGPVHANSFSV